MTDETTQEGFISQEAFVEMINKGERDFSQRRFRRITLCPGSDAVRTCFAEYGSDSVSIGFEYAVAYRIELTGCEFKGNLFLCGCEVKGKLIIESTFHQDLNLEDARVGMLDLSGSQINGDLRLQDISAERIYLDRCRVEGMVYCGDNLALFDLCRAHFGARVTCEYSALVKHYEAAEKLAGIVDEFHEWARSQRS